MILTQKLTEYVLLGEEKLQTIYIAIYAYSLFIQFMQF